MLGSTTHTHRVQRVCTRSFNPPHTRTHTTACKCVSVGFAWRAVVAEVLFIMQCARATTTPSLLPPGWILCATVRDDNGGVGVGDDYAQQSHTITLRRVVVVVLARLFRVCVHEHTTLQCKIMQMVTRHPPAPHSRHCQQTEDTHRKSIICYSHPLLSGAGWARQSKGEHNPRVVNRAIGPNIQVVFAYMHSQLGVVL